MWPAFHYFGECDLQHIWWVIDFSFTLWCSDIGVRGHQGWKLKLGEKMPPKGTKMPPNSRYTCFWPVQKCNSQSEVFRLVTAENNGFVQCSCSLTELCALTNSLIINIRIQTWCNRFILQCRQLQWFFSFFSLNLEKLPCSKVYIHLILNTVLLPEWSTAVFFCLVIAVHESLSCPQCEKMEKLSKSYSHCWKGFKYTKCWKTKEFVGPEGFFWRTAGSLTVQDKQGTHEKLSLNKKHSCGSFS